MNMPINEAHDVADLSRRINDGKVLIAAMERCIKKLENKEQLTFEEQCVVTVVSVAAAEDLGHNATQEYFAGMQKTSPTTMHPIIDKFIDALPSQAQVRLIELGAIAFGYNQDGTVDEKRAGLFEREDRRVSKTYIVRHPLTQLIKIGKSLNPDNRIRTLSTQSGAILKTLLIIDSDIESELHKKFCEFRVCGEWFDDKKGLIAEYANSAKECDQ